MQPDGKSMLVFHMVLTLVSKGGSQAFILIIQTNGQNDVQMETKVGGDGVMETVDQEEVVLVKLKQP